MSREGARQSEVELFSVAGTDGFLREVNESFASLLGMAPEELHGRSILEFVHPDDLPVFLEGLVALERGSREVVVENRFRQVDGRWVHLQWVARPISGGSGSGLWWASGRDTTEFHQLLAEQLDLRTRLELAVGGLSTAAMWDLDLHAGVLTWEAQAAGVLGVSQDRVPVNVEELSRLVHPADRPAVMTTLTSLGDTGLVHVVVRVGEEPALRYLSLRGKVLQRDRRGRAARAVGIALDVTAEKAMEDQMLRMVMSDALTGIPNRRAFDQALRAEWRRCTRALQPLSVLIVDLDDFKGFNDTFGHLVGDDALCALARVLTAQVHREGDVVARFGGEEFAVVLPNTDSAGALTVANRMLEATRAISLRQADRHRFSISAGTATWLPEVGIAKPSQLLGRADQALYAAKASGKDRAETYEDAIAARVAVEEAITEGLQQNEFEVYYQPVIELSTGDIDGFEALIRWNRPGHGLVVPDEFIPIAEASTLICDLGRWVLHAAAAQLASWSRQGLDAEGPPLRMAVNASARHVNDIAIVADVTAALAATGLPSAQLVIELTETALVDEARADQHLAQIRALGVSVALDDFGTGYTSVGQIPHLPVDILKIDKSFIGSTDPRQQELVRLMITAAHAFGLRVVSEGIEEPETLQRLRSLGGDLAQGYLMGRPMPAQDVPSWIRHWHERRRRELFRHHGVEPLAAT